MPDPNSLVPARDEISIYEVFDRVWAFKWVFVICIAVGLIVGLYQYFQPQKVVIDRQIVIEVYPAGSPSYTQVELAAQLATQLAKANLTTTSGRSSASLLLRAKPGDEEVVKTISDSITQIVDDQANDTLNELRAMTLNVGEAVPQFLRFKAFVDGRQSGRIQLFTQRQVETSTTSSTSLRVVIIPVIIGLAAAFSALIIVSFIRGWRQYRSVRAATLANTPPH